MPVFAYPKQSQVNRVIPKTKIYAHGRPSTRIKDLLVAQVQEIRWKNKLSPETVNLPARNGINEIQIFEFTLKSPNLDPDVLHAIDKAIPFPLAFEIIYDRQIRFAASYKRVSEADPSKWVIEATFETPAQQLDLERSALPVALDLAGLYEQIVRRHIPLLQRTGEGIAEQVIRFNALQAKKKALQQLESRLAQEKQFNRRVELNSQLRTITSELGRLQK
jgi:Domain of unknown function (DUF4391)